MLGITLPASHDILRGRRRGCILNCTRFTCISAYHRMFVLDQKMVSDTLQLDPLKASVDILEQSL